MMIVHLLQAKVVKHGQAKGKINLTVDIQSGKLFAVKPSKEILDDSNVFTHDKSKLRFTSVLTNTHCFVKLR